MAAVETRLGVLFFGSLNLFAVDLVGEDIARTFEEVRQRPPFVRRSIIRDGEARPAADAPSTPDP